MTEVSAEKVKELRDKTGAGMMDCKKALAESGGNLEKAIDYLRKKAPRLPKSVQTGRRIKVRWRRISMPAVESARWWKSIVRLTL